MEQIYYRQTLYKYFLPHCAILKNLCFLQLSAENFQELYLSEMLQVGIFLLHQLGHSDYDEITRAAYEELLREDLSEKNMLIKLANEPTTGKRELADIKSRIAQIDNRLIFSRAYHIIY